MRKRLLLVACGAACCVLMQMSWWSSPVLAQDEHADAQCIVQPQESAE